MVLVTGGTFQMGSADTGFSDEQPVHQVGVASFYMDTTDVTQANFQQLMGFNPSYYSGDPLRPVETVTWFDAVLYCNVRSKENNFDTVYSYTSLKLDTVYYPTLTTDSVKMDTGKTCLGMEGLAINYAKNGFRLPTEAEWEYACRAAGTTDFYWGRNYPPITQADTFAIDSNAVWYVNSTNGTTQPVAGKRRNAFGLYDMAGNVWEWCNDWYGSYTGESQTSPGGPGTGISRVLRGGSWSDLDPFLRSANRYESDPGTRSGNVGFRCVRL